MRAVASPAASSNARNRDDVVRLTGPDYARDPHAAFAAMRAEGPLLRARLPFVGRVWTTSTHAAAEAVLKSDAFVLEGRNVEGRRRSGTPGLQWWMPRFVRSLADNMLGRDDPEHRRLRRLVDNAFRRRDVQAMRGRIEMLAGEMVAALPREADLLNDFARPFPLRVIADLLGLRETNRERFVALSGTLSGIASPLGFARAMLPIRRLIGLVEEEIAAARRDAVAGHDAATRGDPQPGIVAELVAAEDELTADELVAMVMLLLVAGYETTSHLIANSVAALEAEPDERDRWLADPGERTGRAVEELARHASPIHSVKPRYVARDMEIMGTRLGAGEIVMPWLGAANADPAVFEAPERLRLDRFPNPHLVFSTGTHFCLGLQLARIEVEAALRAIYGRGVEVTAPLEWTAGVGKRELKRLCVRLG